MSLSGNRADHQLLSIKIMSVDGRKFPLTGWFAWDNLAVLLHASVACTQIYISSIYEFGTFICGDFLQWDIPLLCNEVTVKFSPADTDRGGVE